MKAALLDDAALRRCLRVTCRWCPAQIEGEIPDVGWIYARARGNRWSVHLAPTLDAAQESSAFGEPDHRIAGGFIADPDIEDHRYETACVSWLYDRILGAVSATLAGLPYTFEPPPGPTPPGCMFSECRCRE